MDLGLAADGGSYCPTFALLDDATDEALATVLGRAVTDGCPEPRHGDVEPQWWAVTAMAGVATDEEGRPGHGDDAGVVDLGRGEGILLVTDRAAACALTSGQLRGDAAALVLSFDLDEIANVDVDWRRRFLRRSARSLTVELRGASWGAVGVAVAGVLDREPGTSAASIHPTDAEALAARLATPPTH